MIAIGIDIGGTKVSAGLVDIDGTLLKRAEVPAHFHSPEAVAEDLKLLTDELRTDDVVGVGIGAAGLVDHDTGHYFYGPNTGMADFDLGPIVSEVTGLPVSVDNDANCAAWAEHRFGVGEGCRDFLCITLGTGIGGGFVLGGHPYRGAHGGAAEVGHMVIDEGGLQCPCGNRGCWEQYASGLALERMGREVFGPDIRGPQITQAARDGDPDAKEIIDTLARWVGYGLGNLVNIMEPQRIAVAGGISRDWDLLTDVATAAMVDRIEASDRRPSPVLVAAELGHDAGIVGAALLILDGE